jgi:hypothetical protein
VGATTIGGNNKAHAKRVMTLTKYCNAGAWKFGRSCMGNDLEYSGVISIISTYNICSLFLV